MDNNGKRQKLQAIDAIPTSFHSERHTDLPATVRPRRSDMIVFVFFLSFFVRSLLLLLMTMPREREREEMVRQENYTPPNELVERSRAFGTHSVCDSGYRSATVCFPLIFSRPAGCTIKKLNFRKFKPLCASLEHLYWFAVKVHKSSGLA